MGAAGDACARGPGADAAGLESMPDAARHSMEALLRMPRLLIMTWLAAVAVVVLSLAPMPTVGDVPRHADKAAHFIAYAGLGLLAMLSQYTLRRRLLAAAAVIGLGLIVECVQGVLPWRSFEWLDIVANSAGVVAGGGVAVVARNGGARLPG